MPQPPKCTDVQIIEAYRQTGNIWKAASLLGLCGQSVWERLKKAGVILKYPRWTKDDDKIIEKAYAAAGDGDPVDLDSLAKQLGRMRQFIARKAKALGLTNV